MKLPSKVKIGSQIYKILEREDGDDGGLTDALAYTLTERNLIVLNKVLPIDRKRSVLVHELMHAIIYSFSRQDSDKVTNDNFNDWEHWFISTLQEPWLMILRDNPDLTAYLLAND